MHGCDHHCVNTNGSYECSCESDFMLAEDGASCIGESCYDRETTINSNVLNTAF